MGQNVLITGSGREMALGFNLVRRYLMAGDRVFASARKESAALNALKNEYPETLTIIIMDIGDTQSVREGISQVAAVVDHLDLLINNAVTTAPDCGENVLKADPDAMAPAFNVGAVGPLRVIQACYPLLQKSEAALIVNISSEAGSIGACYRTNLTDYAMTKASVNMMTKTIANAIRDEKNVNIICIHPGWMRTNEGNAEAPLEPFPHAETLRLLFEERRKDKDGDLFITWEGKPYLW